MSDSLKIKQNIECCTEDQSLKVVNFFPKVSANLTKVFSNNLFQS